MNNSIAIETNDLGRVYKIRNNKKEKFKELVALSGVNLHVQKGELFGLLGPNGAGKTTLIKILTTLLSPTSGSASVAGIDVEKNPQEVRKRINMVSGGETSGYGLLTVRENLWMFAQFYGIDSKLANERIKKLAEIVGISDRLNTKSSDLSTGLRQKMNIIRGFLTDPQVLFLDEPTLGLDVGASRDVRDFIIKWMKENEDRTLLLTTHYMAEADELCDRVAIINEGKVLACDTPTALKRSLQKDVIYEINLYSSTELDINPYNKIPGVKSCTFIQKSEEAIMNLILESDSVLSDVITEINHQSIKLNRLEKREPSLEDVFVKLVGQRIDGA
ncbi:MAG TPA: ATP-binding cassette domain-containing protein [Anaerolineaceae bacterium]|nr:ATP-binding cassette domain-containing protein [Anaerolineaceae bacterium]